MIHWSWFKENNFKSQGSPVAIFSQIIYLFIFPLQLIAIGNGMQQRAQVGNQT